MEFNFNQNDDFEEFLQKQLRNQRMYPGDRVWKNIHHKLHGHKKWPALTVGASLILAVSVSICCYFAPKPNIFTIKPNQYSQNSTKSASISVKNSNQARTATVARKNKSVISTGLSKPKINELSAPVLVPGNNTDPKTFADQPSITKNLTPVVALDQQEQSIPKAVADGFNTTVAPVEHPGAFSITTKTLDAVHEPTNNIAVAQTGVKAETVFDINKSQLTSTVISKPKNTRNRWSYLLYAAPSISYRNLFEDRSMLKSGQSGPVGINYVTDVNNVVRHKPGTGIEVGINFIYSYTNKLRIKSGLQFNVRQYNIEAYHSSTEMASIALLENNRIDTVNSVAIYRNNNGYSSAVLTNRYYQLSVPIGIEWEILGNRRIQLNVAGSIQPTYLLNHNAYLLSTNFKNYTEDPGMVRSWNLNSNIETFISLQVGDFKWQFGPQIRYQPYSTFISQYPIKEHLMDYGFKIGVSKIIK